MANTFKVITFDAMSASGDTAETLYTAAGSTTTVVNSLVIANIHTADVTIDVKLVSTTANRGNANNTTNTTSFLLNSNLPSSTSPTIPKLLFCFNLSIDTSIQFLSKK